jgi:hypothetical protein
MVLVRSLNPRKIFEYLGTQIVRWSQGRGAIVTPRNSRHHNSHSRMLPNACDKSDVLIAPNSGSREELAIDFVPLLILLLLRIVQGLLTIAGDPASSFIVARL